MKILYNSLASELLEIKKDNRTEVFNFGKDNAFPSLVNALASKSPTTKACFNILSKAIYGGGFGDVFGSEKANTVDTVNKVYRILCKQYAKHNNAYLHISYDLNYEPSSYKVVKVKDSRLGKDDDKGYVGKFVVYDNWDKKKSKKISSDKFILVDRFNPNKEVIRKQIEHAGGIDKYNGQILHLCKDEIEHYGMTDLEPAIEDAYNEVQATKFRSSGFSTGFVNTKLMVLPKFSDKEEKRNFKETIDGVRGVENTNRIIAVEAQVASEDLSKSVFMGNLTEKIDDKIFEYSEKKSEANICRSLGVPKILLVQDDSGVFGNSGAMLLEAKKQVYNDKEEDRDEIVEALNKIRKLQGLSLLSVINPYEEEMELETEEENVNEKAQANLRGSVGGVTSLLAIQQSVGNGTTTKSAGIEMIVNIFGFNKEQAEAMIGEPKKLEETQENDL